MNGTASKPSTLIRVEHLAISYPGVELLSDLSFVVTPGLTLIRGGQGRGKSTLLRLLYGAQEPTSGEVVRLVEPVCWETPEMASSDALGVRQWFRSRQAKFPHWNTTLEAELTDEFGLTEHLDKSLFMLSKGSRRKLGLIAAFACGAPVSLLDTPFAALDARSSSLLSDLLADAASHPTRAWVVAGFELPADLLDVPLANTIELGS
ncbi:MAG: ABC-type multidrug transport system ATPase subunit [Gammaproteobacteria bacterium]|jgi:ABC-type multidrug transport system ATPase subunit